MEPQNIQLVDTGDGSHSLRNLALDENYHSWNGAVTESRYVFVDMGLKKALELHSKIKILEVGLGTGLNAALSLAYAVEQNIELSYIGLETFPIQQNLLKKLNFPEHFNQVEQATFQKLIESNWDHWIEINKDVRLYKCTQSIHEGNKLPIQDKVNLIYYDAFGPEKQPDMWQASIWDFCFEKLEDNGILVTYCAKGQFKRDLKQSGFIVESLPGPPGKREMVRAIKRV